MDLKNLTSRVKREFLRNKKKSAILAIASVVAIYFWAPLVMDWLPVTDTTSAPATVAVLTPQATPVAAATAPANKPTLDWLKLSRTIAADLMMEHVHIKLRRNPFAQPSAESLVVAAVDTTAKPQTPGVQPGPAIPADEIKLTSIMIGPAFSEAVIDGETYVVDDELEMEVELPPTQPAVDIETSQLRPEVAATKVRTTMKARIVEIRTDHVLLVLNHRMRKLPLYHPVTAGMTIKQNSP